MLKMDLTAYEVTLTGPEGPKIVPFKVGESIALLLFMDKALSAEELLRRAAIAQKVRDADGESVLLDRADYDTIKKALDGHKGFTENDVEFVRRIYSADVVEIAEKKRKRR